MPPKGEKLSETQIADLVTWVKMGAPDPRSREAQSSKAKGQGANHWAFKPVVKPVVPEIWDLKFEIRNPALRDVKVKGSPSGSWH